MKKLILTTAALALMGTFDIVFGEIDR